jgi:hypothetical protein
VRRLATALLLLAGAASLPGCIFVARGDKESPADTPNGRALSELEKRMDRVESRIPK